MAFVQRNLVKVSAAFYDTEGPQVWGYKSSADTLATIKASAYFNAARPRFNANDLLYIVGSDGSDLVNITSASDPVTVSSAVDVLSLAEGNLFLGDSNGNAVAVDFSANAQLGIGDGTTFNSVAMSGDATIDNAGAVTIANDAINTSKIINDAVTTDKIADANVTSLKLGTVALSADGPYDSYRVRTAAGATNSVDIVVPYDIFVTDVVVATRGAGDTSDTMRVTNGTGSNHITNAMDINVAGSVIVRPTALDVTHKSIASAGTLRVTATDNAGADLPAIDVAISCWKTP